MSQLPRALSAWAFEGLTREDPMVFLTGPRQVGKTFLARQLSQAYYNWDTPAVRSAWLKDPLFYRDQSAPLVVFDEIHKRRDWKRILKGAYDDPGRDQNFLVTGSGRFDLLQRGGDSLQGRYFGYRLWPLFPEEARGLPKSWKPSPPRDWNAWVPGRKVDDADLREFGGFPAPYLKASATWLRKWEDAYVDRLVREDARDFSAVQRIDQLELLSRLLPERVGSPLSMKALSEDIDASPVGVKGWLRLLETLYLGWTMPPFSRRIHRAVKKERKWYFYAWTLVKDPGARFENYLAVQLALACSAWSEQGNGRWELHYLRDQDRREVDFVITRDLKPIAIFEAKSSPQAWPASLSYYQAKLGVPGFLVYPEGHTRKEGARGWSLASASLLPGLV